jgi:oxygen-independent coproporphyrinogen-3 oxidase
MAGGISIYFHLPFCRHRCTYCTFTSFIGRKADTPAYTEALKMEVAHRANGGMVSTVYFGGGTPSSLPANMLSGILASVRNGWYMDREAEITLEVNPGDADTAFLTTLRQAGVNRLSIGVQSFNDEELMLLGRHHTTEEATTVVVAARQAGFDNISLDLMFGLPGQSVTMFSNSLRQAIALAPEHVSLYPLSLEAGTPLATRVAQAQIPCPDSDITADQYQLAGNLLARRGYVQYEISNWSRPGHECRHNLTYWMNRPYLGFGVAAHSYENRRRYANTTSLDTYLGALTRGTMPPLELEETLDPDLVLAETLILGLRLNRGVITDEIRSSFGIDLQNRFGAATDEVAELGLIDRLASRWKLTARGRFLSNEVFWRLLPETTGGNR